MAAYYMKTHTGVSNVWLARKLWMGVPHGVSRYVSQFEREGLYKKPPFKSLHCKNYGMTPLLREATQNASGYEGS
jgi:hypothetical protein